MICCLNWLARAALVIAVAISIAGCSSATSVSDELSLDALQKKSTGVAVMFMRLEQIRCPSGTIVLGQKADFGYDVVHTLRIADHFLGKAVPPQSKLAAGRYHVIGWTCRIGNRVTRLGAGDTGPLGAIHSGKAINSSHSYASFTVKPGEVVNVGMLQLKKGKNVWAVSGAVTDLTSDLKAGLQEARPKLYAKMTTRLMTLTLRKRKPKPITKEQLAEQCRLHQAMSSMTAGKPVDMKCD